MHQTNRGTRDTIGDCEHCGDQDVPVEWTTCKPAKHLNMEPTPDDIEVHSLKLCTFCQDDVPPKEQWK